MISRKAGIVRARGMESFPKCFRARSKLRDADRLVSEVSWTRNVMLCEVV